MRDGLTRSPESRVGVRAAPAVLGCLGIVLVLLCTSRYGVGMAADSANYISAARSLLSGNGYRYPDGGIYTHWPPLFPTLLAGFGLVGVEPLVAARFLNAIAFGAIVFLSARLFTRSLVSGVFAALGTVSILLSAPLLSVSVMALSEPIFIVLMIGFLLYAANFLQTGGWRPLLGMSILAGLACLQRYAGVTLILAGGILVALGPWRASIWRRLGCLAGFGVISSTPLALWIVRNRVVAGETAGAHHFHLRSVGELARSATATADVMAAWLYPQVFHGIGNAGIVSLVALLAGAAAILWFCRREDRGSIKSLQVGSVLVFGLIYVGFLILSGAGLSWNPDDRVLLPAYVVLMLALFAAIEYASGRLGTRRTRPTSRIGGFAGLAFCVLWLSYPFCRTADCVLFRVREGAGDYCTRQWKESPMIRWLQAHPLQGEIYSNVPDGVYALTGSPARTTPHYYWDTSQLAENMSPSQVHYIVWSDHLHRDYLYDRRELLSRWRTAEVATFCDGGVYRVLGDGGPGVMGVHRFWLPHIGKHLYVLDKRQVEAINLHQRPWCKDEGMAFYVPCGEPPADALPVHQFRSETLDSWFYTMDEAERDKLVQGYPDVWRYEGIAWYAWPGDRRPAETLPVYRFWSDALQTHFYTIEEQEKDKLAQEYPQLWRYETVAWYAYGK